MKLHLMRAKNAALALAQLSGTVFYNATIILCTTASSHSNLKKTTTKTYIRKISIEQHHHKGNQPKFVNNHDANYLATPATVARPPDHG